MPRLREQTLRTLVRAAGRPLAFLTAHSLRLTGRRVGAAVMYHGVGDPGGSYTRELVPNLPTDLFRAQVRHLSRAYRVVPATGLLEEIRTRRRGQRIPVAITFDDDLASHLHVAAPLLEREGLTATFFLTGATLERPRPFWWQRLQAAVDRGLPVAGVDSTEEIHATARRIQLLDRPSREAVERRLEEAGATVGEPGLRRADVGELAQRGFEIGFHTHRHDFLPRLSDSELAEAMREGAAELAECSGAPLRAIAYPHGGGDARVASAARGEGFVAGFITGHRAIRSEADPLLLERIEGSFTSAGHLALRIARELLRASR